MYISNKFIEIMKVFPKEIFDESVSKYKGNHYRKRFKSYDHLLSMIYGQLSGSTSLREIEYGFNEHSTSHYHLRTGLIKKSTLSDANNNCNPEIFLDTLNHLMTLASKKFSKNAKEIIEVIDSSPIQLKGRGHNEWSKSTKTLKTQGLKLHVSYNYKDSYPTKVEISAPNVNDITVSKEWDIKKGYTYIFDKGYYDFNWWWKINQNGSYFVSRFKKNAAVRCIETFEPIGDNIISDEYVIFKHKCPRGGKQNYYTEMLRRVTVHRPDKDTPIALVTNRFDLSAVEVAGLYKDRWNIEIFFKWIKQKLKIKKFIGESRNAVIVQIYTALITFLLLAIYKKMANINSSMTTFFVKIKSTLFCKNEDYYNKRRRLVKEKQSNQMELLYG